MAKSIGEVAIKLVPNFDMQSLKKVMQSASTTVKGAFKGAFDGINRTFSKGGAFLTGLNSGLQIVKEIASMVVKMENSVKEVAGWAGNISDFAQSVGFKQGEEASLVYILSQLAAGGIGQENAMRLIEELTKRISSGEVLVQEGLSTPDTIASAFAMLQGLQGTERLALFRKLFGENVLLSGDIDAAISAYGTHSANRLGEVGTYEGYLNIQRGLERADWAMSELAVRQLRGDIARTAALGQREGVYDPETGFVTADIAAAIVKAEEARQEAKTQEIKSASDTAIEAAATTLAKIEQMMTKAGGWVGEFADKIIKLLQEMASERSKWWDPRTWGNKEKPEEA